MYFDVFASGIAINTFGVDDAHSDICCLQQLVGYNYLAGRFKRLRHQMEDFALEFLNLTERNFT